MEINLCSNINGVHSGAAKCKYLLLVFILWPTDFEVKAESDHHLLYKTHDGNTGTCYPWNEYKERKRLPVVYKVGHDITEHKLNMIFINVSAYNMNCKELLYAPMNDECKSVTRCLELYSYNTISSCMYACPCKTNPCKIYLNDFDDMYMNYLRICEIEVCWNVI